MIKEIREFYGIPQNLLADYLGVTRSQLSMAEIGKRDISASKRLILLRLYKAIRAHNTSKSKIDIKGRTDLQKSTVEKLVAEKIQQNNYKLTLMQKSLNKLKEDQLRALRILKSLEVLKTDAEPGEKGLLDIIEIDAEKLYKKTEENFQLTLELRIQGIKAETAFLRKKGNIK